MPCNKENQIVYNLGALNHISFRCMCNCPKYPQVERDGQGTNGLGCSTCHGLGENLKGAVHTVPTVILSKNIAAVSTEEKLLVIKGDVMPSSI